MSTNRSISLVFMILLLLVLLPFIILSFFTHAGTDDYLMQTLYNKLGFVEIQTHMYTRWTGRFFSYFLQAAGMRFKIVTDYYFAHIMLLFILTYLSAFNLANSINRFILRNSFSFLEIVQIGFILLMLNIYLLANTGDNFYWFSAAIVYQTAIIILFVLIALLIKRFTNPGKKTLLQDVIICLLLILLSGCNETMPVIIIVLLTVSTIYLYTRKSAKRKTFAIYWLIMFITCCIIYVSSGIQTRQKLMNAETGFIPIIAITCFRTLSVFYYILREPLFWVTALGSFLQGMKATSLTIEISFKKLAACFLLMPLIVLSILLPLLLVSKGSFPDRALNNIIIVTAWLILALCFLAGRCYASYQTDIAWNKKIFSFMPIFFSIALLFSACQVDAWKSVCSGYFYSKVLKERDQQFTDAKKQGQTRIQINTYSNDVERQIQQVFPNGIFQSLHTVFLQKPTTIPFFNEAEEDGARSSYAIYYGVDDIYVRSNKK